MGTAAEFLGGISHRNDSDHVIVLLIKQSHGTCLLGTFDVHYFRNYRIAGTDVFVNLGLNGLELFVCNLFIVSEVETAIVRSYE